MKRLLTAFGVLMLMTLALTGCLRVVPPTTDKDPAPARPEATQQSGPVLTIGQEQAARKAESYLRISGFSRTGLIGQLEFEGFATADAEFAVDYLNVDWNEQAARKAESYLKISGFSRQGLIDQLLFEGFTPEQAEFGVTAVGY